MDNIVNKESGKATLGKILAQQGEAIVLPPNAHRNNLSLYNRTILFACRDKNCMLVTTGLIGNLSKSHRVSPFCVDVSGPLDTSV